MPWCDQYSRCNFLRDRRGVIESDLVFTIFLFIYLFNHLCVSEVQSLLLSSWWNKNHILTKQQLLRSRTSNLLFPVTTLCTTSFTLLCYLTASISMKKIPFLSLFWSWVEGLLVLGCSPLSATNRVSHSKISVSSPSYLSLMVPWMEVDSAIYDGRPWTACNRGQQSLYLIYQKCSATPNSQHTPAFSFPPNFLFVISLQHFLQHSKPSVTLSCWTTYIYMCVCVCVIPHR